MESNLKKDTWTCLSYSFLQTLRSAFPHGGDCVILLGHVDEGEPFSPDELSALFLTFCEETKSYWACSELCRTDTTVQCLLRLYVPTEEFVEVRIAVLGQVDAAKSTLISVLVHDTVDNGRGLARSKICRHAHELETGQTSSISHNILGFDAFGRAVNRPDHQQRINWTDVCRSATKLILFVDLAGHLKYLKTSMFGLTGSRPDCTLILIGANASVQDMTREHMKLCVGLGIPIVVIITKIDMAPPDVRAQTILDVERILSRIPGPKGIEKFRHMTSIQDILWVYAQEKRTTPIFQISNVTGENIPLLKQFLNMMPPSIPSVVSVDPTNTIFQIDSTYQVPGVGTIVSGIVLAGTIRSNDTLQLGPVGSNGAFIEATVRSIHRHRLAVQVVHPFEMATLAVRVYGSHKIIPGMVMSSTPVQTTWTFEAELIVLHHASLISCMFQSVVHIGAVRQTARIIWMDCEHIMTGKRALVRLQFIRRPVYIHELGQRFAMREGTSKCIGKVTAILSDVNPSSRNRGDNPQKLYMAPDDGGYITRKQRRRAKKAEIDAIRFNSLSIS